MEYLSSYWSENGKREARIMKSNRGFSVEFYERSRLIRTVDLFGKSLVYAENTAENWTLGIILE